MDEDQDEQLTVAELTVWIEKRQSEQVVLNIARGTTDPGYRVYNLSYLSS